MFETTEYHQTLMELVKNKFCNIYLELPKGISTMRLGSDEYRQRELMQNNPFVERAIVQINYLLLSESFLQAGFSHFQYSH
jgi:hypothetical protein